MRTACCVFLLAAAVAAQNAPPPTTIAVLEFRSKLEGRSAREMDAADITEEVRGQVRKALPGLRVFTRENVTMLVQAQGKQLEDCESKSGCEVETGRLLGADLVVTGLITRVGSSLKLILKLHDTRTNDLVDQETVSGHTVDELDADLPVKVAALVAKVKPRQSIEVQLGKSEPLSEVPALSGALSGEAVQLDVRAEVLEARDHALSADEKGKEAPDVAAKAWRALAEAKGKNPFHEEADKRARDWQAYAEKKQALDAQLAHDTEQIRRVLPLRSVPVQLKSDLMVRYARLYGPDAAGKLLTLVAPSDAQASVRSALACEARDASACLSLAKTDEAGHEAGRAASAYERACDAGSGEGCEEAGSIYLAGGAVARDNARAFALLGRACDAGRAKGCLLLGRAYETGDGVKADQARAIQLFDKACTAQSADGCHRLAVRYDQGLGVSRDAGRAEQLFRRSCQYGDSDGCARVRKIDDAAAAERQRQQARDAAARAEFERVEAKERERKQKLAEARESAQTRRTAGGWLLGGGIALGAGAGFFAYEGKSQNDKVAGGGFATARDIQSAIDKGHTFNTLSYVLAGGAVAAAGVGALLLVFGREPSDTQVGLMPGGLVVAGRFP